MIVPYFQFTMSGPSVRALVERLREVGLFPTGRPESIGLLTKTLPVGDDWFERTLGKKHGVLTFDERWTQVIYSASERTGELVNVRLLDVPLDVADLVQRLSTVPFELASFAPIHLRWRNPELGAYVGPSLGDLHTPVGWAIAFRGSGHQRLVSRELIAGGPWQVHRGPDDTTLLQLHDLDAEITAALAQARSAHDRLVADLLRPRHR